MNEAMIELFPAEIKWTVPDGGMFLWVTLPKHMSAKVLLEKAVAQKGAYVYGEPFHANGGGENTLRMNYSNATHENIKIGVERLAKLFKENM